MPLVADDTAPVAAMEPGAEIRVDSILHCRRCRPEDTGRVEEQRRCQTLTRMAAHVVNVLHETSGIVFEAFRPMRAHRYFAPAKSTISIAT